MFNHSWEDGSRNNNQQLALTHDQQLGLTHDQQLASTHDQQLALTHDSGAAKLTTGALEIALLRHVGTLEDHPEDGRLSYFVRSG